MPDHPDFRGFTGVMKADAQAEAPDNRTPLERAADDHRTACLAVRRYEAEEEAAKLLLSTARERLQHARNAAHGTGAALERVVIERP